jgi:fermentation-respiration switch protein FrsA (DUF1100 family)
MTPLEKLSRYLLRICVFQIGEYKSGYFARLIVKFLKRHFDLLDKNLPLTSQVLESFILTLEDLGGIRSFKVPADGLANIDFMLLTYENVKQRIEQAGGKWLEIAIEPDMGPIFKEADAAHQNPHYLHLIIADQETPDWAAFCKNTLYKLGWEKAEVEFSNGVKKRALITNYSREKFPERKRACFLRCHSPGRSYGMDQKYVGYHLSLKRDLCLFNHRGTHRSRGKPSEGGYYLDADSLFQELQNTHSYKPEQIWVAGFCLGAAVAAYLKAKYHEQGIHYVGENTFTSLESAIRHQIWPVRVMGIIGIDEIRSSDPAITSLVEQDSFNTLHKFNKLKKQSGSFAIIIETFGDDILPRNSSLDLFSAIKQNSQAFHLIHQSHCDSNPHSDEVFTSEKIQDEYERIIS